MIRSTLILILFILLYNEGQAQTDERQLAQCLIHALQGGRDSAIINCMATKAELNIIREVALKYKMPIPPIGTIAMNLTKGALRNYYELREKGDFKGVSWNSMRVDSVLLFPQRKELETFDKADIIIYVHSASGDYVLRTVRALEIKGRWRLMDKIEWLE